jgi:mono/diheme cytochrome c family protein
MYRHLTVHLKYKNNRQMNINFTAIVNCTLGAATVLLMGSCVSNADSSGLEYMPDMYRSPAIEPYVDYGEVRGRENMEAKMTLSAMTPPSNTIPYFGTDAAEVALMLPYARKANISFRQTHGMYGVDLTTEDDYAKAAADKNPMLLTKENAEDIFKQGKKLFAANCMHCHGEKGDGNGPMMVNETYVGVPNYAEKVDLSDGQLFYSIYYGKGAMGAHSSLINKKEIWTLVHYIRKFQDETYGSFEEVAAIATGDSTSINK